MLTSPTEQAAQHGHRGRDDEVHPEDDERDDDDEDDDDDRRVLQLRPIGPGDLLYQVLDVGQKVSGGADRVSHAKTGQREEKSARTGPYA
jgi:hypothetical protein